MFADAHLHLSDSRISDSDRDQFVSDAFQNKITYLLEAGVHPEGWIQQIELQKKYPQNIRCSFGLHPYFVAENERDICESAMDQLAQILNQGVALGETGLDFREQYIQGDAEDRQIVYFENQLQLAHSFKKPLVLHIVRSHNEVLRILWMWKDQLESSGMIHAFNSSYEVAKQYIDYGFMISIGGAVTYPKNNNLADAVKKIPLEYLLIESDSPDQKPMNWPDQFNQPSSVLNVAASIAHLKGLATEDVLKTTTENFKRLFTA